MVNYGGDEVAAVVLDIGTSSVRAGYAGDDSPKAVIPTSYGFQIEEDAADVPMESEEAPINKPKRKLYIGQHGPSVWRPNMHVENPMLDGLIADFDPIPALINHAFRDVMHIDPSEHPVLLTEPPHNLQSNRERMAEIMFEEFNVPAFYVANTGVLNAFASGKGSALVVDIGHAVASVTPVVDGFVLRKGMAHSTLPKLVQEHAAYGLKLTNQARQGIALWPHQLIANKMSSELGAPPRFALREDRLAMTTDSWRLWAESREVDEWVQSVGGVLEHGWNGAQGVTTRQYEFPTGYNTGFAAERYTMGEQYFNHSQSLAQSNANLPRTIPALISDSLRQIDPELRTILMSNVVLTGGGATLSGFSDRLNNEMLRTFPHVKLHSPGNSTERRFGAWLGGSILGSLGTFHQLWISKEEWQEHGKSIVAQRCK